MNPFPSAALVGAMFLAISSPAGQSVTLPSPDKRMTVTLTMGEQLTLAVHREGRVIIGPSAIALRIDGVTLPRKSTRFHTTGPRSVRTTVPRVVRQKSAMVHDHYTEQTLEFPDRFSVIVRAYANGIAYRFHTTRKGTLTIDAETFHIAVADSTRIYFPEETSFFSHNEREYRHEALAGIAPERFCSTPALLVTPDGLNICVTESSLEDYPGLWLAGTGTPALRGLFPAYVLKDSLRNDRDAVPTNRADFLARTSGPRSFPWRVFLIEDEDAGLLTNDLVFLLSPPSRITDPSWITPGKVAWDWWNANNVTNVDFRAGINTDTYKHYIDFAARYGVEYVILDEGWYPLGNLLATVPTIDMPALVEYARRRDVGLILWVVWRTLADQLQPAMEQFSAWGIKGLKVDFMQRDDQTVVRYYWDIAREAAQRKLLVDFHGSYKPSGLFRAYPNVLTSEGVRGLENAKWSAQITPEHCLTIPFIRMAAGPMDFTPGAMVNLPRSSFKPMFTTPASMGTRCQQLAMYVVYESPLQMLCDSPTNYMREPACMEFLGPVPTVWDTTIALNARVAQYLLMARRSGNDWYLGAMTDDSSRTFIADLSFLGDGTYTADIWEDGLNAGRNGNDFRHFSQEVTRTSRLTIPLAPGGGWVARIHR